MATFIEVTRLENRLYGEYKSNLERARDLNDSTEIVHRYVWLFRNERRYVLEIVVPLFKRAIDVLQQAKETGKNKEYIEHIAETIELRLKNLDNYLKGELSDFCSYREIKRAG